MEAGGERMQSLAARLACGEESAFAELYDACADRLHNYLTARLGCRDRADEVLQATFVRVVQNRKRFAGVENPVAYLFQMARNEVIRVVSRENRSNTQQLSAAETLPAVTNLSGSDDAEAVASALARLSANDRELIELKIYAGLTFQEIGRVTGRPQATVATRYRRALESLRPWLERQFR